MNKETYKGTNVKGASTEKIIDLISEIFNKFDLNDNNTIDFNIFISELKERSKILTKELKETKSKLTKQTNAKNYYKNNLINRLDKNDILKLLEDVVE